MSNLRCIINADDFGRNHNANVRIEQCFLQGRINSSSLMANMEGFDEAIEMIMKNRIEKQVGVHLVFDEGKPITKAMQNCNKFCDEQGAFRKGIPRHQYLNRQEREIVYNEIISQIDKIIAAGIKPNHVDSHRHRHQDLFIAMAAKKAMINRNIVYVRRYKSNGNIFHKIYGRIITLYYTHSKKIKTVDGLLSIFEFSPINDKMANKTIEIMCHPEMDADYDYLMNNRVEGTISYTEL